jgi:hypothetical protein
MSVCCELWPSISPLTVRHLLLKFAAVQQFRFSVILTDYKAFYAQFRKRNSPSIPQILLQLHTVHYCADEI